MYRKSPSKMSRFGFLISLQKFRDMSLPFPFHEDQMPNAPIIQTFARKFLKYLIITGKVNVVEVG